MSIIEKLNWNEAEQIDEFSKRINEMVFLSNTDKTIILSIEKRLTQMTLDAITSIINTDTRNTKYIEIFAGEILYK